MEESEVEEDEGCGVPPQLGLRFSRLAAEVEAVLRQIREREARAERAARPDFRPARPPHDIYKRLPGRPDFEYIKVPKKPPELCFGSKTERKVFPNIPEILKKQNQSTQEVDMSKLATTKVSRSRTSSAFGSSNKDQIPSNNKVKK